MGIFAKLLGMGLTESQAGLVEDVALGRADAAVVAKQVGDDVARAIRHSGKYAPEAQDFHTKSLRGLPKDMR